MLFHALKMDFLENKTWYIFILIYLLLIKIWFTPYKAGKKNLFFKTCESFVNQEGFCYYYQNYYEKNKTSLFISMYLFHYIQLFFFNVCCCFLSLKVYVCICTGKVKFSSIWNGLFQKKCISHVEEINSFEIDPSGLKVDFTMTPTPILNRGVIFFWKSPILGK